MGIFDDIGRAFTGKPKSEQQTAGQQPVNDQPGQAAVKAPPKVRIGRIENDTSGSRLNVYADLKNESDEPLVVTRISLCDAERDLDHVIRAGDIEQLLVYSGPIIEDRPSRNAELRYRRESDKRYFLSYYEIRIREQDDEGYFITELLQRGPVKLV